ncbi:MAG TPA: bifunctional aspartate kinase/homoserine dehydrogenase I, partial [Candidatus Eisenbacteria bacterium]
MLVMKFGGTSVGIAANCERALEIVRARAALDPVVVVSALSGVTNQLVELCRPGEPRERLLAALDERHLGHARSLGVPARAVEPLLAELR